MWERWVLDASMGDPSEPDSWVFCPVEGDLDGEFRVVTGMNMMGEPAGEFVAVVHPDGDEKAQEFVDEAGGMVSIVHTLRAGSSDA